MTNLRVLFSVMLILLSIDAHALDLSSIGFNTQPDDILAAIKRDENLRPHFTYESSISNLASEKQCIRINHSLHKGLKQRSQHAFKWVIDVPIDEERTKRTIDDVAKLDALVSASLLSKDSVLLTIDSEKKIFDRYRLTIKGWKATIGKKENSCFYLGKAMHLSVTDIKEVKVPISRTEKETAYQVTTLVGFPKDFKLPEWANNPEVRNAYPLINKLINGYEHKIMMEQNWGRWREYLSPATLARMEKSGKGRSDNYFSTSPPATKVETMLETFKFDDYENKNWSCISLPGDSSNGVRVDKNLKARDGYGVIIYSDKERSEWDDIEKTTKPYLDRLVSAGLLTTYTQNGIAGDSKDKGKFFTGTVYRIAPEYQHIVDPERNCIFMGKGKVNVVDIEILASNTKDLPFGRESIKYKYIMTYPNPPEWAKDPVLQAWWSDLKGALQYGRACEGEFEIDLSNERKMSSGAGSCWWAYDSVGML